MRLFAAASACLCLALTGCSLSYTGSSVPLSGSAIRGSVHGGQQPIVGARIYLFSAGLGGYGGNGIAAGSTNASQSLLNSTFTGHADAIGAYVLSGGDGSFSISGDYICNPGTQVYALALGGNAGAGTNSAIGLMAVLGTCPASTNFLTATPFITINEVSTVAAAYSMAGFATDPTHVSSSGTPLAKIGIANAFANAANLASLASGTALTVTPAGNGTSPQAEINTLANLLGACVNSTTAASSAACTTLFGSALSAGTVGSTPTDTATAAINIAHNPGANIAALYGIATGTPLFNPTLPNQPNDFTVSIGFTVPSINATGVAIDGSGNVWISNFYRQNLVELASSGAALSPAAGYTGGGVNDPYYDAIDLNGNVWVTNAFTASGTNGNSISEFSSSGTALSTTSGDMGAGLTDPLGIAIDASGSVWVAGDLGLSKFSATGAPASVGAYSSSSYFGKGWVAIDSTGNAWATSSTTQALTEFGSNGSILSGTTGYTGGGLSGPQGVGIDNAGNVWVANYSGNSISKFSNAGMALSAIGYFGGGLNKPKSLAIDGAGSVWVTNSNNSTVSHFSGTGTAISGLSAYSINANQCIAIDASGNLWAPVAGQVTEAIGVAAPVVVPLVSGVATATLGTRP